MKKLMFAALVAVAAVSAHANTLLWGVNAAATLDTTKFANATAYLMSSSTAMTLPTPDTTKTSFSSSDLTAGTQLATGTMTGGAFEGNNFVDSLSGRTYFYVAFISDDGKNIAISTTTKTATMGTGTGNTSLKWMATQFNTYTAAPEPTSGLLMLVGFGALALRRRRA